MLDFWLRRWRWLACWTILFAIAGGFIARAMWSRSYTSSAQLIHYEPSAVDDTYRPRALATPSLIVMLQSPGFFTELGAQLQPPLSAKALFRRLQITLDRNNDVATVTALGASAEETVDLVQRYCDAVIAYTQAMQGREAVEAGESVNRQLAQVEAEIAAARAAVPAASRANLDALAAVPVPETAALVVASDLPQRIQAARGQLDDLRVRYTDVYPLVREQEARVAALEDAQRRAVLAASGNASVAGRPTAAAVSPAFYGRITAEEVAMGERFRSLEANRAILIGRQRAIAPFRDNPPGYFRVLLAAAANPIIEHRYRMEFVLFICLGAFFGLVGSASQILLGEFLDNRIKTRADVRRVTGLPLLATLGDVQSMEPADREQWAFRAWTTLQNKLSISPNHGMVCGITSAHRGDGRSTHRERAAPVRGRFRRWLGNGAALGLIGLGLATPPPAASAAPEGAFSVVNPARRADWQRRLTLGPGDVLSFHLFGAPELTRENIPIGPDGRISYLEAENIHATGLTVDELRHRLNEELGKYRRSPQAFVTPRSYPSKRYYVLGTVVQKGIFPLDRPITIIEAVARARGFETGLSRGNLVETTDFSRSFLGRGGQRLPVDFEKLFLHGDLSQNIALEPGDYLNFPAAASGAIHVLGEIRAPGAVPFDSDTSVLSAIASRGGFTERAWKKHVLVVRNSQVRPEAFKVDAHGALTGKAPNFALQPDDFIFLPSARTPQVHILGAVIQPHSERMTGSLTVVQAIALSGGSDREAFLSNVAILRGSLAQPQIAIVAVDAVLRGQAPDVRLEPGDIVYVPYAPQRVLSRYVNLILDTFARTVGVNAGVRTVSGDSAPIGIGVNIAP